MHPRLSRPLFCALAACSPALGLVMASSPAASASTAPASRYAGALAAARTAIEHLSIGWHDTDHRVAGRAHGLQGLTQVSSANWSGYAVTSSGFATVTGSWTEPATSCPGSTTSLAAFWVGMDGYSSPTVEQDGTLVECYLGTAYNFSWWEMYPANDIQVVGESVAAGDQISASVVRSGHSYTLQLTDSTRPANSFTTTQSCSDCDISSAEWIAEAPTGSAGIEPLSDFRTWTESGATVDGGVISSITDDHEITMIDPADLVKAQPGPLNSSGNGFSVTWIRSS
jgi:Peptidase A4 family